MSYQLPPDSEWPDFRPAGRISSLEELKREVGRGVEQLDRGESHDSDEVFGELLRDLPSSE